MISKKIKSFTDLIAWRKAHQLVLRIYKQCETFPKKETFGIIDQLKRAVISISSNIAEGFSRKSLKDKTHFYYMALGSLTEVQNLLLVSRDIGYIQNKDFQEIALQTVEVSKLINSLIKFLN